MRLFFPFWAYRNWHFGDLNQNSETTFQYKLAPKTPQKATSGTKIDPQKRKSGAQKCKNGQNF